VPLVTEQEQRVDVIDPSDDPLEVGILSTCTIPHFSCHR